MNPTLTLSRTEGLFWEMLRPFEILALEKYRSYLPSLATTEKETFINDLSKLDSAGQALGESNLAGSVRQLLQLSSKEGEEATLIIQGLLLEKLGSSIYDAVSHSQNVSPLTRHFAERGKIVGEALALKIPDLISKRIGCDEKLFSVLVRESREVLQSLDPLGEEIDQTFSETFQIRFADLMGQFSSDFIQTCVGLGVNRKKLMCHLTGALMGL